MKKNRFWMLALLAISFTGCYTSFSPRDYEQESYGKFNEDYYNSPEVAENYDSLDFLDEEYLYSDPQVITINNNYPPNWAWDYYSPSYVSIGYCNWGGFYDPFYDPYWGPSYGHYNNPYYGGNVYVYGDAYFGSYYGGYGNLYYPSQTRYRTNRSHWTNLRDNGGRRVASRDRRTNRGVSRGTADKRDGGTTRTREIKGFDLNRALRVTRNSGSGSAGRTRKDGLRKQGDVKTARRTTDLERRRISDRTKGRVAINRSNPKRNSESQRVTKRSKVNNRSRSSARTSQTRSKRTYSSSRVSKNRNSSGSSRSYHPPSSRSSNRSSNVSQSQRNSGASRSYNSTRSSTRNNSSSRSSYSTPSRSSSSPSVSRSSSSSSRSSGSRSSSSSNRSSRGRR